MGLSDIVRSGIATANAVTADTLQDTVTLDPWTGEDEYAKPQYDGDALTLTALIEYEPNRGDVGVVRDDEGEVLRVRAVVNILQPIEHTAWTEAASDGNRDGPVDKRDKLTLPDGRTGPILSVPGLVDPSTDAPYMFAILLGY